MARKAIAVLVGIILISILRDLLQVSGFAARVAGYLPMWRTLIVLFSPHLIACMVTGYIAQRDGWLLGLLVAFLFTGYQFLFWLAFVGPATYFEYYDLSNILNDAGRLISGTSGGFLGQLLAQEWHKRAQRKADASQSKTS